MIGIGTIINTIAVLVGGTLGTALGARLPEKVRETVMHDLGLVVLAIGVHLSLKTTEILIVLGSVLLELKRIRTGNLLPAILIAPIIVAAVDWFPRIASLR